MIRTVTDLFIPKHKRPGLEGVIEELKIARDIRRAERKIYYEENRQRILAVKKEWRKKHRKPLPRVWCNECHQLVFKQRQKHHEATMKHRRNAGIPLSPIRLFLEVRKTENPLIGLL